jgi:hypothetical protein
MALPNLGALSLTAPTAGGYRQSSANDNKRAAVAGGARRAADFEDLDDVVETILAQIDASDADAACNAAAAWCTTSREHNRVCRGTFVWRELTARVFGPLPPPADPQLDARQNFFKMCGRAVAYKNGTRELDDTTAPIDGGCRVFVLHAVRHDGDALAYAPTAFKDDEEVVVAAIKQVPNALEYASGRLKNTKHVVVEAVNRSGMALEYASTELKSDLSVVIPAVRENGMALEYASTELKSDLSVVIPAVRENGMALQFADPALRADKRLVLAALEGSGIHAGDVLMHANPALKDDNAIAMDAVKENGFTLREFSAALQDDKDVVMAAVAQDGGALRYASGRMKDDKDVVMAAVAQDGGALRYASARMKDDEDVVRMAIRRNPNNNLRFASSRLQILERRSGALSKANADAEAAGAGCSIM